MAHRRMPQLPANVASILAAGLGVAVGSSASSATPDLSMRPQGSADSSGCTGESQRYLRVTPASYYLFSIWQPPSRPTLCEESKQAETESQRFERTLKYHRSQIAAYRKNWEYNPDSNATTSTKTPSRSWPDNVPSDNELPWLIEDVKYCARSPNFRSDKDYCSQLSFRVASALVVQFNETEQKRGLEILKSLAEKGHPDAMVYYGMCLNDGRAGLDPASDVAVSWFKRCSDMYEHPQAQYELGVAFYTGEGVAEDEEEAVRLFELAAEQSHPAACYMLGDCLLDGIGVEMDRELALEWLVRSSELGHRGARSRVMAVLEKKKGEDYDGFTDASRQTLIATVTVSSANKEGQIVQRRTTLRKEIGGGSRNPTELARRQTIVSRSRKES